MIPRLLLGAALLLSPPLFPSSAYQPVVVGPGGSQGCSVHVSNLGPAPRGSSARVRVRGHRFFGSPRQAAVRGEWVPVEELLVGSGVTQELAVDLPVPLRVPPVIEAEIEGTHGLRWTAFFPSVRGALLAEPASVPAEGGRRGRRELPFRVLAGGRANPETDYVTLRGEVAATAEEWDALRADFGILAPDSWNLHPADSDTGWFTDGYYFAEFASETPPDLGEETVIGIRTPGHDVLTKPLGLWVRSVERRGDGAVVCRYSYRFRRIPIGNAVIPGIMEEGKYVLVAIPRTDGPVVFRRVP